MKKIFLALLLFKLSFSYCQEKTSSYKDAFHLINIWLEAQKDYEAIPSIMGVVVEDQQVIWHGAFGKSNLTENRVSDPNTICSICSISKTFTAVAIMKLVDEGKVGLDDKVKDILTFYNIDQKFPEGGAVTVRSILSHSSGLPRDTGHSYWSGPDFPFPKKKELKTKLSKFETMFPVGTDVKYSNLGYAILGLIIEEVSGLTYKEYVEANIFKPLGMSNSHVEMKMSEYGTKHAIGYTATNRNGKRKQAGFYQTRAMQPAAGISTTIMDIAKYASWIFRSMGADKAEILKPSSLIKLLSVQSEIKNGNNEQAFGFQIYTDSDGNKWAMHGGICPGFVSYLKMDVSNKTAYAILANANGVRALRYVNSIIDILKKAKKTKSSDKLSVDLSLYSGFYNLNPWNSEYYISEWDNGLVLLYLPSGSLKYSMYFYSHGKEDTFYLLDENGEVTGEELKFFRNKKGAISKVKNDGNYHYRLQG